MNRKQWKFAYTADKLLEAAKAKHAYHEVRIGFWSGKKDETMNKIKAEGLEIDESVAGGSYLSKGGREVSVNVRDDLLADLNECTTRLRDNRNKLADYDAWIQVLASQGQASLELDQEDWLFFFGK